MTANFVIIGVGDLAKLRLAMYNMRKGVIQIGGKVAYNALVANTKNLKERLIYTIDKNLNDAIILFGDSQMENISEVIKGIVTEQDISEKLKILLADIEEKLSTTVGRKQPIYGIRNKTLIINMTGSCIEAAKSLKKHGSVILQAVRLISKSDEREFMEAEPSVQVPIMKTETPVQVPIIKVGTFAQVPIIKAGTSAQIPIMEAETSVQVPIIKAETSVRVPIMKTETSVYRAKQTDIKDSVYRFKKFQSLEVNVQDALELIKIVTHENTKIFKKEIKVEIVDIYSAYGRILYYNIHSRYNVPSFRSAANHGYAVVASDGKRKRRVVTEITSTPFILESGTCIWVRSGERIPDGATAIVKTANTHAVKVEYDSDDDDNNIEMRMQQDEIELTSNPEEGENIRPIGYDIRRGTAILAKNTRIGVAEIGLLALCGYKKVTVYAQPSIGILSIGDELEEPGNILRPGHVYDSNRTVLTSLLKENDFECMDFGIVAYDVILLIQRIKEIIENVDVLVTIGSANDRDILKPILKEYFNAEIIFGRVNIKPGKSTTFAQTEINNKTTYFLCLSGNPASVPIAARLFLLPLLNELRDYDMPNMKILARVRSQYDLHLRPKCVWTDLKWDEDNTYASVFDTADLSRNLFRYHNANALLMLPARSPEVQNISEAFVTTLYIGPK